MEENDKISIETLISNNTKQKITSSNEGESNGYHDFEYNIDEILKSKNWVNENNINILEENNHNLDNNNINRIKQIILDLKNYFKDNKDNKIKRIITFNGYINNDKEDSSYTIISNIITTKSDKSIFFNNLKKIRKIKIKKESFIKNKNKNNNENIDINNMNIYKEDEFKGKKKKNNTNKSISSGIMTEIEIESSKNNSNNIYKNENENNKDNILMNNIIDNRNNLEYNKKENKEKNLSNLTDVNKSYDNNNQNNKITLKKNLNPTFNELYDELEKEICIIKTEKTNKNQNISDKNKKLMEVLYKITDIFKFLSKNEGKYDYIFKQILNKVNYYIGNKNNYDFINLITEIEENQKINISLKKEYQKLMNAKPYKDKSILNERKKIEYKENLKLYDDLNNKISKMENILNNLKIKLKINKKQKEYINSNKIEYDENKLKEELIIYNNDINKLKEEIVLKEKELFILNNNSK